MGLWLTSKPMFFGYPVQGIDVKTGSLASFFHLYRQRGDNWDQCRWYTMQPATCPQTRRQKGHKRSQEYFFHSLILEEGFVSEKQKKDN